MKEYNTQCASYSASLSPLSHEVPRSLSPLSHGRGAGGEARAGGEAGGGSWVVRPMSKSELGMAYAPCLTPQGAVNRLMQWIHYNPELVEALDRTGYRKTQKMLTSLQVRIIVSYLGEP